MTQNNPKLDYKFATVAMPGTLALNAADASPHAVGSSVRFIRGGYYVSARVPTGIFQNAQIKEEFVQPLVELVSSDLATIDDLLPALEELSHKGDAPKELMYSRDLSGNSPFRIYDNHSTPPGQVMDILLVIKNSDLKVLNPDLLDLYTLSSDVCQNGNKLPYVEGSDLKYAVLKVMRIYAIADRLREIKARQVEP